MHIALDAERVGPAYTEDGMLLARRETREALAAIAARIRPGMLEEDDVAMAKQVLLDMGLAPHARALWAQHAQTDAARIRAGRGLA
ncbi:hypothetical protein [Janthinobacterium sp. FT14W]|uniref:hypothetical protein n=1 Tax=Janthinobacterium sp. FT14W TaxID=2654253 RepID=UPI0029CA3CBB|nr:hypothetical protein [Janthinobacterium sp. FT14W]